MKQIIIILAAFSAFTTISTSTQAATNKGEQIFNQKCAICHKVKGKGGAIGPELTKVSARLKENDLINQIENPKKKNPSTSMPSFKALPKADLKELLGYLKTLK